MTGLSGKRVLVVEDDPILSLTIEDVLVEAGAVVIGPVAWLKEAEELAGSAQLDVAILDVNINGGHSYSVAGRLAARGIPFVFATGYGSDGLQTDLNAPILHKPYNPRQLQTTLRELLAAA